MGNRAPRYDVVFHTLKEIRKGHGPIYIDCRHLNEKVLTHLMATLGYDKDTLPDYFKQRGEDLGTRPVEINVSEGMQAGPTEVTGSGIKIDKNSAATIAGLFACGDACDHNRCVHGAVAGGYKAGKSAAAFAQTFQHGYQAPGSMTRDQIDRFMDPLHRSSGYPYRQIEDTIRKIMGEHVIPRRTEHALTRGLEKPRRVEHYLDEIRADDLHELMRTHETRSIQAVGKLMATTALFRKESRNKPYHHRLDFPDSDDTNWCGLVVVRKEGDELSCDFEPVNQR